MRTKRPISINNSLSHGICNYNCELCGVNKATYCGPREFQPEAVTRALIGKVQEAARHGLRIRYIANAGDGEPTLHPDFAARMNLFGQMIREWDIKEYPAPEVSVVTNGYRLLEPGVLDAFVRNTLTLIISLPTRNPEAYGQLMVGKSDRGAMLLSKVIPGIREALRLRAKGDIRKIQFHISPPKRDVVRRDFGDTVHFLAREAGSAGVDAVELILFPATSNRAGLIRNKIRGCDMYHDLFKQYNGKIIHGVKVSMRLSYKRFFPRLTEFVDLIRAFDYPCTWNSQLFITAAGDSICCNDQAVRNPMGNVLVQSLVQLMETKESYLPGRVCAGCDQSPARMTGSPMVRVLAAAARLRLRWATLACGWHAWRGRGVPGTPAFKTVVLSGSSIQGRRGA